MRASSSKAREEVDSCGTCRASFQPQIRRNCASRSRASSNCLVVPNPYTALATKALAIASRCFAGRPTQPRLLGTKRDDGSKPAKILSGGVRVPPNGRRCWGKTGARESSGRALRRQFHTGEGTPCQAPDSQCGAVWCNSFDCPTRT